MDTPPSVLGAHTQEFRFAMKPYRARTVDTRAYTCRPSKLLPQLGSRSTAELWTEAQVFFLLLSEPRCIQIKSVPRVKGWVAPGSKSGNGMDDDLDDLLLQVAGRSEPAPRPRAKGAGRKRSRPAVSESDEDADGGGPGDSGEADDDEEGAYRPPARKAARTPLKKRSVAKVRREESRTPLCSAWGGNLSVCFSNGCQRAHC